MAKKTWTLLDVDQNLYVPEFAEGGVKKRTLQGGLREGVDLIEVDNGIFAFTVIPTRGMGIWQASLGNLRLEWKAPVKGPVHPKFVHLNEAGGLGWLDGFDELLVRCGLESNGAPEFNPNGSLRYGLHGKIANLPAHQVTVSIDQDTGEVELIGVVDEARLFGNKMRLTTTYRTQRGRPGVEITDVVMNLSDEPGELELLYHVNFGAPIIDPGAKVVLPVKRMAPRDAVAVAGVEQWDTYAPPRPGTREECFFFNLVADSSGQTLVLLHNSSGGQGVSLRFSPKQWPCFTLWKNCQAVADGYVTGLEPATNFPNRKSFEKEKGRVLRLAPGESRTFEMTMEAHPDANSVNAAKEAVRRIQSGLAPQVLREPDPEWSAW